MRGILEDCLIHQCLSIILEPLKCAAQVRVMLSDSWGYNRCCFTPIASYIIDTPEAAMLARVGGKTSPITTAMYKQFGDPFQHEPCTASTTLAQLAAAASKTDPSDIEAYFCEAQKFCLSGVDIPFWHNHPLSCPSRFLTLEMLHHFHKKFWDHNCKWCINALGAAKIDFRFSVLQPILGLHHFKEGISLLKQVMGHTHRDVQHFIVGVITGSAMRDVVIAIHALMDFCYRAQAYQVTDKDVELIRSSLHEFHSHKDSILTSGLHCGTGNKPIDNWYILKLELMQNVVPSIPRVGITIQWSTNVTEHAHIDQIKDPVRGSNNNNYNPQICHQLNHLEKCRNFELAMSLKDPDLQPDTSTSIKDDKQDDEGTCPSVTS